MLSFIRMVDTLAWNEYPIDLEDGTTQNPPLGAVAVSVSFRKFFRTKTSLATFELLH